MIAFCIFTLVLARSYSPKILSFMSSLLFKLLFNDDLKALHTLKENLQMQEKDLASIFIMDEFAKHARLSRKVSKLSDEIEAKKRFISNKKYFFTSVFLWGGKLALAAISFYVFIQYRYTPVLVLPDDTFYFAFVWNLISFPIRVVGNVSCVFWALSCQVFVSILDNCYGYCVKLKSEDSINS